MKPVVQREAAPDVRTLAPGELLAWGHSLALSCGVSQCRLGIDLARLASPPTPLCFASFSYYRAYDIPWRAVEGSAEMKESEL